MTNGLSQSLKETKIIKYESYQQNSASFKTICRDKQKQEEMNIKFLGLEIDKHTNWVDIIQIEQCVLCEQMLEAL